MNDPLDMAFSRDNDNERVCRVSRNRHEKNWQGTHPSYERKLITPYASD